MVYHFWCIWDGCVGNRATLVCNTWHRRDSRPCCYYGESRRAAKLMLGLMQATIRKSQRCFKSTLYHPPLGCEFWAVRLKGHHHCKHLAFLWNTYINSTIVIASKDKKCSILNQIPLHHCSDGVIIKILKYCISLQIRDLGCNSSCNSLWSPYQVRL